MDQHSAFLYGMAMFAFGAGAVLMPVVAVSLSEFKEFATMKRWLMPMVVAVSVGSAITAIDAGIKCCKAFIG